MNILTYVALAKKTAPPDGYATVNTRNEILLRRQDREVRITCTNKGLPKTWEGFVANVSSVKRQDYTAKQANLLISDGWAWCVDSE